MKTTNEILTDIWNIVTNDVAIAALNGGIYRKTRPTDSELNDCVIHLIPGVSAKFLNDGAIYIKLFYNDIFVNNSYLEDSITGSTFEQLLIDLSKTLLSTEGYSFDVQSREHYTEKVDEIHQYYAILKMNFKLTQN